jgi:hypothetical protein
VDSLQSAVDAVTRNGKVALVLAVGAAYTSALAELLTWDGRGLTTEEWAADHDMLLSRQRDEIAEQAAAHAAEQQQKIDEWRAAEGGDACKSAEDDNDNLPEELREPFVPREPEWDGSFHLDTAPFVLPFAKTRVRVEDHVERCRRKLVRCMKAGGTAVVDVGSFAPDFVNKVCLRPQPLLEQPTAAAANNNNNNNNTTTSDNNNSNNTVDHHQQPPPPLPPPPPTTSQSSTTNNSTKHRHSHGLPHPPPPLLPTLTTTTPSPPLFHQPTAANLPDRRCEVQGSVSTHTI